jgi:hypothetical protein
MTHGILRVQRDRLRLEDIELVVGHAVFLCVIEPELLRIEELALSRRVVVDRDQPDQRQVDPLVDRFDRVVGDDLAPQVEAMVGAGHALVAGHADRLDHAFLVAHPVGLATHVAQRQRVEHGRDAGGGDLGVVCHHRRHARPFDAGTRREVLLEIVGMQLDQARHEIVAFEIGGAGGARAARIHLDDAAVADHDSAVEFGIERDHAGVRENRFSAHVCAPGRATLCRRVASASRTATSWKMPTMAAPASRRWRMRSITPSRLATSSEAVGSSSSSTG